MKMLRAKDSMKPCSSITNEEIPSATAAGAAEDQQRNVDDRVRYSITFYLGKNLIKPSPSKINISQNVNKRLIN